MMSDLFIGRKGVFVIPSIYLWFPFLLHHKLAWLVLPPPSRVQRTHPSRPCFLSCGASSKDSDVAHSGQVLEHEVLPLFHEERLLVQAVAGEEQQPVGLHDGLRHALHCRPPWQRQRHVQVREGQHLPQGLQDPVGVLDEGGEGGEGGGAWVGERGGGLGEQLLGEALGRGGQGGSVRGGKGWERAREREGDELLPG